VASPEIGGGGVARGLAVMGVRRRMQQARRRGRRREKGLPPCGRASWSGLTRSVRSFGAVGLVAVAGRAATTLLLRSLVTKLLSP
jgi:hypothetical protein